jgi:beta-phosphoglucomutase family hydrolase
MRRSNATQGGAATAAPPPWRRGLALPQRIRACLFDLDGVLTDTARVHRAAWADVLDHFLLARARVTGAEFVPFDAETDYDRFIDGRMRYDGVRTFLASRGIELREGDATDPPTAMTVCGLGNRKDRDLGSRIRREGVEAFPGSVRFVTAVRAAGIRCAVVSASANCDLVLRRAGIENLFDDRVDGRVAGALGLRGKPAPDTYLEGARRLGLRPADAAVFEDALAGVEAGAAGGFGFVVGVARHGAAEDLARHGADVVVSDLAELIR